MLRIESSSGLNGPSLNPLRQQVNDAIQRITAEEIEQEKKRLMRGKALGERISDNLPLKKRFDAGGELIQYLSSGAPDIVHYLKYFTLTEIALCQLMAEGKLMPISWRDPSQFIQVEIEHRNGNEFLHAYPDMMPFGVFMVAAPS